MQAMKISISEKVYKDIFPCFGVKNLPPKFKKIFESLYIIVYIETRTTYKSIKYHIISVEIFRLIKLFLKK